MKKSDEKKEKRLKLRELDTEDVLVIVSLLMIALTVLIALVVYHIDNAFAIVQLKACASKTFFGIPCPGCGATRALFSIFRGDLLAALRYNSFVVYVVIVYTVFVSSHILKYITKNRVRGIKYRHGIVIAAIVIVVVQYILKLAVPYFNV